MHTAKCLFAECQNKGTRQNTSLSSARIKALGKDAFCRVPKNSTRQNTSLPSARKKALGKDVFCRVYFIWHSAKTVFAECPIKYTRQSLRHSAKCRFPVVIITCLLLALNNVYLFMCLPFHTGIDIHKLSDNNVELH